VPIGKIINALNSIFFARTSDNAKRSLLGFPPSRQRTICHVRRIGGWRLMGDRHPTAEKIKFWGVVRGSCWLSFDGEGEPIHLEQGDVFLSSTARALVMASDLAAPRVDLSEVLKHRVGATAQHGSATIAT